MRSTRKVALITYFLLLDSLWQISSQKYQKCQERNIKSAHHSDASFLSQYDSEWVVRQDGSMEYQIRTCKLKRFTAIEARKCLQDHHLLFIGDSLSRFQYLSLVYFIDKGRWLSRFRLDSNCSHLNEDGIPQCRRPGEPNLNDPHMRNYKSLHIGLGGDYFDGRLECQCFRGQVDRSVENMYYELNSNGTQVRITYMSDNVVFPMKGWNRSSCTTNSKCQLTENAWHEFGKTKWDYEYFDYDPRLYDLIASKLAPDIDIALINRGLWTGIPTNISAMSTIFGKLSQIVKRNSGRCFWKGTTVPMEPKMTELLGYRPTRENFTTLERDIRKLGLKHSCEPFDLSHVTSHFVEMLGSEYNTKTNATWNSRSRYRVNDVYIDRVHFQPWVYEEFNQILLNTIC